MITIDDIATAIVIEIEKEIEKEVYKEIEKEIEIEIEIETAQGNIVKDRDRLHEKSFPNTSL